MAARLEIFCDFDGTVTTVDSVDVLLERLADPSWRAIEELWERGEIGSRECMARQIGLFAGGWPAVRQALDTIEIDPTLARFVAWSRERGIPFRVVSDGLDMSIGYVLARAGVDVDSVIANRLVEGAGGSLSLEFPYSLPDGACSSGVCKCDVLERANGRAVRVFIGDGRSDFCCSVKADILFAKARLLAHCLENDIPCIPFATFDDIRAALEERYFQAAGTGRACLTGSLPEGAGNDW